MAPRLRPFLQTRCFSERIVTSKKLFELRIYDVLPKDFPTFMEHTSNFVHLRVKYSNLLGYWTTEIGGQNQVVHMWEYESLAHRKQVRDLLGADVAWHASYMTIMRPMLVRQTNSLLLWAPDIIGLDVTDIPQDLPPRCQPATPGGYYRLVEASLPRKMESRNAYLQNVVANAHRVCKRTGKNVELYGVWFSAFAGKYNNCFSLWRSDEPDDLLFGGVPSEEDGKWVLDEDHHSFPSEGRLLLPCSFSRHYASWS